MDELKKLLAERNIEGYTFFNHSIEAISTKYLVNTKNFKTHPIEPELLTKKVLEKLNEFNIIVSKNTPQLIAELCKSFNHAIFVNKHYENYQNFILSPQTGSAKSLSAKVYISLLNNESSIVIVPRVDVAIEFCMHINEWSGNQNYARCIYQISNVNKNHVTRVEEKELCNYRCIVITHNMFIKANTSKNIDIFKNYQEEKRDFILIDERVKLFEKRSIEKHILEKYIEIEQFHEVDKYNNNEILTVAVFKIHSMLQNLLKTFEEFKQTSIREHLNILYSSYHLECCRITSLLEYDSNEINKIIQTIKDNNIDFVQNALMPKETNAFNKQSKVKLIELLKAIKSISENDFIYYKDANNESIATIIPIENLFGTCVTLDATAKINMYYQIESMNGRKTTRLIETTSTKTYSNLTIHKAKGYFQGKSTIYKSRSARIKAKAYLELIERILEDNKDNILIITSKDFRKVLESLTANKRIYFTHWGNHTGKNEWNNCARTMIVGWNFYKNIEYYGSFVSACESIRDAFSTHMLEKKIRHKFKVTQVADDLVQAVNRSAIRNTIDENGNCPKSHIYIFYADKEEYLDIMAIFLEEFEGAKIQEWSPKLNLYKKEVKSKPEQKIDAVITFISNELKQTDNVLLSTIPQKLDIPKSTLNRLMKHSEFSKKLSDLKIQKTMYNKKSIVFCKL